MREDFRKLRAKQLDRALQPFQKARTVPRPAKGWLRATREALGISAAELARRLGASRQLPWQMEKAEAEDRITLRSLRSAAAALECELIYALVPREGSLQESGVRQAENLARTIAKEHVRASASTIVL